MDYSALSRDGLILFDQIRGHLSGDSRSLRRDAERGRLVALRRGAFVERPVWDEASPRERHVLRARAALAAAQNTTVLAGVSAAAVWGMPIGGDWPADVTLLDRWRGGGRSEPGVRKTAAGFMTAQSAVVDGLPVTTLARTALDVARARSFADAAGSLDWALWRKNPRRILATELADELSVMNPRTGIRDLRRLVTFATDLSDSFGESKTRAVIRLLGFDDPLLQVPFRDEKGTMEPDYYWPKIAQAAEFDGKVKYTRDEFTGGDPSEVVWREKLREDRLRGLGLGVTRIVWADMMNPPRLERLLLAAGVPRGGDIASRRGA
jgi:hypothetical protein